MMDSNHHQSSSWLMAFAAAPVTATGSVDLLQVDRFMVYLTIATSVILGVLAGFSWRGARLCGLLGARSPALFGFHRLGTILLSMALAVPALRGAWDLIKRFSSLGEGPRSDGYGSPSQSSRGDSTRARQMTLSRWHPAPQFPRRDSNDRADERARCDILDEQEGAVFRGGGGERLTGGCSNSSWNVDELLLGDEDLQVFQGMLEDEDPVWEQIVSKSTSKLTFAAWRREVLPGPTQYRSTTIFEGCTPELVANFFWDDDFRPNWDDMLVSHRRLEGVTEEGAEIVHWTRRFPFFCSPRDYVISRRIWSSGRTFYCVTKGIYHPAVPRQAKPRRVDIYCSSWLIREVPSPQGNSAPATEVMLFHHEEMGIQRDLAKFGVRKGMWGCVKKMEPGIEQYEQLVRSQQLQDRSRFICTRIEDGTAASVSALDGLTGFTDTQEAEQMRIGDAVLGLGLSHKGMKRTIVKKGMKMALIAGGVVLACGVNHATVYKLVGMGLVKAVMKRRMEKQGIMPTRVGL